MSQPHPAKLEPTPSTLLDCDWPAQITFVSYGVTVRIRVNDDTLLEPLLDHLPPGWEPSPTTKVDVLYSLMVQGQGHGANPADCQLYRDQDRLVHTSSLSALLVFLDSDLRLQIGMVTPELLFVHAGVVGWQQQAIVIPGRSFSGKTTLVTALIQAGATYYSDEYAVFDTTGLVFPYARPLLLRNTAGETVKQRCPVEQLGGQAGTEPLPVGLIVTTQYQADAYWRPHQMSAGDAVMALFDNTIVARLRPEFALAILPKVVSGAVCLQGERGEAQGVAANLMQQIANCDRMEW